jgi:hypothetical protein
MKNGEIITVTLDYDKNIYLSPRRQTENPTNLLNGLKKLDVYEELNKTLSDLRDNQWNVRTSLGFKYKRVRWHLQVNVFFKDFSDTDSFEKGPRLKALLRKRKIPDDVQSNQIAIESGLFETSAPSEESDGLLKGLGFSDSSDDAI